MRKSEAEKEREVEGEDLDREHLFGLLEESLGQIGHFANKTSRTYDRLKKEGEGRETNEKEEGKGRGGGKKEKKGGKRREKKRGGGTFLRMPPFLWRRSFSMMGAADRAWVSLEMLPMALRAKSCT